MKILALRGENIASLGEKFEIDFCGSALGSSGLFAIVGPTGSGKSSLLDCLCLCLYDMTPRFAQSGGVVVRLPGVDDESAIAANDQRNLLRHGAGAGWAEVDFTNSKGDAFTAKWAVRRARGSATGRMQTPDWSLRKRGAPSTQVLVGGRKTEVSEAIQKEVGLTFEQFRRSVLLAQGDFAAFLQASENERANLLEQMTGSDDYTKLSIAAYHKAKEFDAKDQELQQRIANQPVLSPEQRAQVEQDLAAAVLSRSATAEQEALAQAAVKWHEDFNRLHVLFQKAQADTQNANAASLAAAPRRAWLATVNQAWPLRALAHSSREAHAAAGNAEAVRNEKARLVEVAGQSAQQAALHHRNAIQTAAGNWNALEEQLNGRLQRARNALQDAQAWLDQHPQAVGFCGSPELRRLVGAHGQPSLVRTRIALAQELRQLRQTTLPTQQAQVEQVKAAATQAEAARRSAESHHTAVVLQREAAEAAAHAAEQKVPSGRSAAIAHRKGVLQQLHTLSRQADDLHARLRATEANLAEQQARHAASLEAETTANQQLDVLTARLTDARQALDDARAAADATTLRATLRPAQPCPVCGGTDHPWADGSPLAALVDNRAAHVHQLEADVRSTTRAASEAKANANAAKEAANRATTELSSTQQALAKLAHDWAASWTSFDTPKATPRTIPALVESQLEVRAQGLSEAAAELAGEEAAFRADDAAYQAAREALRLARELEQKALQSRDALSRQHESLGQDVVAADRRLANTLTEVEDKARRVVEMEADLLRTLQPLAAELTDLPHLVALANPEDGINDADEMVAALTQLDAEVQRRHRGRAKADIAVSELMERVPAVRTRAETARSRLDPSAGLVATPPAPSSIPALDPPNLTDWLTTQVQASDAQLANAEQDVSRAEISGRKAAEEFASANARWETLRDHAADTAQRFSAQRTELGIDAATVEQVAGLPDAWPAQEKEALATIDRALADATVRQEERQRAVSEHGNTHPNITAEESAAALLAAKAAKAAADERWSTLRTELATHEARVQQTQQWISEQAELRRIAKPWHALNDCIGSATGKEFRKFVQSLTLELLLFEANSHLRRLHPRYRLARVANSDLEILIVDSYLGDEARTIRGLSGGEGFLVSLALALGLSSISSRNVRIESLFIDEGFGTLDQHSLEQALSVLEGLQSEGRQVGIISHVGGLAERIGSRVEVVPQGNGQSRVLVRSVTD